MVPTPIDWGTIPISDGLDVVIDYRGKTPPKSPTGIPLISAANVKAGRVVLNKAKFISQEDYQRWTTRGFTAPGDVLITTEAPAGEVAPYPRTGTYQISRRVMALRADETTLHHGFLLYALQSWPVQQELLGRNRGTTVPRVLKPDVLGLNIPLPPLPEQRRIAAVLGALDDKIELNRQMNRSLEEMAQAVFKSWFIDFDGHDPDDLVDSELGPIPRGWDVGTLEDQLTLQRGFDLPVKKRTSGPFPVFTAGGLNGSHDEYKVAGPGVVTGRSGKLGTVYLVQDHFWPLNTTLWVKKYRRSGPYHAYHLLQTLELERFNAGSAVPTLNRNHVHGLPMVLPPMAIVDRFEETVASLFERKQQSQQESETLAALRDTLLPKLISGEVRVPEAEDAVGAAL